MHVQQHSIHFSFIQSTSITQLSLGALHNARGCAGSGSWGRGGGDQIHAEHIYISQFKIWRKNVSNGPTNVVEDYQTKTVNARC